MGKLILTALLPFFLSGCMLFGRNPAVVQKYEGFGGSEAARQRFFLALSDESAANAEAQIATLNGLRHNYPANILVHREYQDAMRRSGRGEELLEDYDTRLGQDPGPLNLFLVARLRKDREAAERLLRNAVGQEGDFYWGWYGLGLTLARGGDSAQAETMLRRSLEIHPEFLPGYRSLGELLEGRDFEGCLRAYKEALRLDPQDPDIQLNLGILYLRNREPEKARRNFEWIIQNNPDYMDAYYGEAAAFLAEGNFQAAKQVYERILARDADQQLARYNLGILFEEHFNDDASALAEYQIFYDAGGDNGFRWFQAGIWIDELRKKLKKP